MFNFEFKTFQSESNYSGTAEGGAIYELLFLHILTVRFTIILIYFNIVHNS